MHVFVEQAFSAMECHPKLSKYVQLSTLLPDNSAEVVINEDRLTLSLVESGSQKILWSRRLTEEELLVDPQTGQVVPSIDTHDIPGNEDLYASTPVLADDFQAVAVGTWRKRLCIYNLQSGHLSHLLCLPKAYDVFPLMLSFKEQRIAVLATAPQSQKQIYDLQTHALLDDQTITTDEIP